MKIERSNDSRLKEKKTNSQTQATILVVHLSARPTDSLKNLLKVSIFDSIVEKNI